MGFALRRRSFSSWFSIFIGVWLLALVGVAARGTATATALQSGTFVRKVLANGTRLYLTDRFVDQVRAFRIDPGPSFTEIAAIPTGETDLDRSNPRDLAISADGTTLYVANTLGHTIAVIDIAGDANTLSAVLPVGSLATDVKVAGRWGIVSGHSTNSLLNAPEYLRSFFPLCHHSGWTDRNPAIRDRHDLWKRITSH